MKALLLATAVSAAALSLPGGALATPIGTNTVDFSFLNGSTTVASGRFSYATGASGVLGYGDLTDFSLTVGSTTYLLADVLPLTDYMWFSYDIASNSFATGKPCGFSDCSYTAVLGAANSVGTYGFFFGPTSYMIYGLGGSGGVTSILLTPVEVPEPGTLALLGAGLLGLGMARRRAAARAG